MHTMFDSFTEICVFSLQIVQLLAAGCIAFCFYARGKSHGPGGYIRATRWFPGQVLSIIKLLLKSCLDVGTALRQGKLKHGDIYYTMTGFTKDVLVLNNPDDWNDIIRQESKLKLYPDMPPTVEKIHGSGNFQLLAGPKHQLYRKIFSSLLTPKALECFAPIIVDHFRRLWKKLEDISSTTASDSYIMLREHVRDTQFELMCKILFGIDKDSEGKALEQMRVDFEKEEDGLFMPEFTKKFKEGLAGSKRNKAYLRQKFQQHLNAIKDMDETKLQQKADDSHVGSAMETVAHALIKYKLCDDKETMDDIIDNLNLLLEASHGTSIYVTTSMLYFLHLPENRDSLERIRTEVSDIQKTDNLYQTLKNNMPFAEGCINETMRLAPIIEAILYVSDDTQTLKIRGQSIPAPKKIFVGLAVPTMDATYFAKPSNFIPGRWVSGDPMECSDKSKTAFRMMGIGRHVCLGQSLARLALKAVLYSYASDPKRTIRFDITATKIKKQLTFPSSLVNDGLMGKVEREH